MASGLKLGQSIEGKLGTYVIASQLHKNVWTATNSGLGTVVVKINPKHAPDNERRALKLFQGSPVADKINAGLIADVKLDNILVNYGKGTARFDEVVLSDFGDVYQVDAKDHVKVGEFGHPIGAAMFRSPEAMLTLRWGTPTDIWSFGTTLMSLIWGFDFFPFQPDPNDADPDDADYATYVLIKQVSHFGPIPLSYLDLVREDVDNYVILGGLTQYIKDNKKAKPFALVQDKELTEADRTFLLKIMKLDPRDRPTAKELLQDSWFNEL